MSEPIDTQPPGRRRWIKAVLFVAVIVALYVATRTVNVSGLLDDMRGWVRQAGAGGPAVFIAVYVGLTVLMVPGTIPTAAAGGLFGAVWGTVYVSIAATIGAAVCFLVSRYLARDAVADWLAANRKFAKLDAMTETHGVWIVAITRLVPVFPFNLLNYGFGLTSVRFWPYVVVSWVCMLPGTVLYVVGADAVFKAVESGQVPWPLIGVAAGVLAALLAIGWLARGKLRQAEHDAGLDVEAEPADAGDGV